MNGTRHQTTVRMSEWARREAEWTSKGWKMASVAVFKSGSVKLARVVLVKDDDE
jgi:hypothetical protein